MVNKNSFAVLAVLCLTVAGAVLPQRVAAQPKTSDIVFGPVSTYNHKSGWFSLAVPGNWSVTDKSDESEMILSLADPTESGILVVRVYRSGKQYSEAELEALLKAFLNERLGTFDAFSMGEQKSQRDGSLGLYFKYNSIVEDVRFKMNGDAFIEQHNGLLAVLTLIMPQDQYEQKKKAAYEMVNSFRVTGSGPKKG